MTVQKVTVALQELGELLEQASASKLAAGLRSLAALAQPHGKMTTAAFIKRASPREHVGSSWMGMKVGDLLPVISGLHRLLLRSAGAAAAKEIGQIVDWLSAHQGADLSEFLAGCSASLAVGPANKVSKTSSGLNLEVIERHEKQLKATVGASSGFVEAMEALRADKSARKQEVVEIARRILPEMPKGLDRKKALNAIVDLHTQTRGFDLKLKAMSGRSAA